MNVFAYRVLETFWNKHVDSQIPLKAWYFCCRKSRWKNFNELNMSFPDAFPVGDNRVVFDIKGNRYRLVARVLFDYKQMQIKWIGTHTDYDKIDVKNFQFKK
jgi:mRNA interferase HigB